MDKNQLPKPDGDVGGYVAGKKGNETVVTNDASKGGEFVGRPHSEGGIKGVNKAIDQPIEVEGGEVIVNKKSVADPTEFNFEGKKMNGREIMSYLNQRNGGVAFAKGGEVPQDGIETDDNFLYLVETISQFRDSKDMEKKWNKSAFGEYRYANFKVEEPTKKMVRAFNAVVEDYFGKSWRANHIPTPLISISIDKPTYKGDDYGSMRMTILEFKTENDETENENEKMPIKGVYEAKHTSEEKEVPKSEAKDSNSVVGMQGEKEKEIMELLKEILQNG